MSDTFVLANSVGAYAVTCYIGGGFGDRAHNAVRETTDINSASIFDGSSRRGKPYKYAIENRFIEIPAYSVRKVFLGERPHDER